MSNTLWINVVKTVNPVCVEYGFTARDGYASYCDIGYESKEEFLDNFPNEQALIDRVMSLEEFSSTGWDKESSTGWDKESIQVNWF